MKRRYVAKFWGTNEGDSGKSQKTNEEKETESEPSTDTTSYQYTDMRHEIDGVGSTDPINIKHKISKASGNRKTVKHDEN